MKIGGRARFVLFVLVAAALLFPASCALKPGGVFLTITSSGLNGQTGFIRMELHEETENGEYDTWHEEGGHVLNDAAAYQYNFSDVTPGTYVVVAYLDILPYNSIPSSGDAIPSAPYPTVIVTPDDTIPATIHLDTIKS